MPSNHLILCCPLLLFASVFPSIRVFSSDSALHIRWSKYWSFSFFLPMKIQDWFLLDWLVWSPCSPRDSQESSPAPQFESTSSLVLSLLYGPTLTSIHDYWKNHVALTIQTFVGKVMPLLFNTLSGFVIAFLARSKHILILWLQLPTAVILEPNKIKSVIAPLFFSLLFALTERFLDINSDFLINHF